MSARQLWAGFLLLILSLQWIGGVVYVKLSFSSWIDREMNTEELLLAQQLEEKYGWQTQVNILDEEEQRFLFKMGYATPFLFSSEDGDQKDYYTLHSEIPQKINTEIILTGPAQHEREGKAILGLDKLFSPYIIKPLIWQSSTQILPTIHATFTYHALRDQFDARVPSPPPNIQWASLT